ncbi:hypothetical protein ZOD2009_06459 [Haladaptatus paucihalophilus DX253]|uniref:DUF4112 domain-containing protein n=1 Tax=Haladaptatus paucihalophilus DX253 TaxID=797209 RepID=E7QR69_HALPU|nr:MULTISPECIES: DUF4112 domain-containing protein [Haladaptatus]EFW92977.1 hypothetical protein ZOD2009_06459 [Haladaptatus paucihalophilus DX253]GKZ15791.1 hypothetical protein HAL_36720 [Haladaptatus sp. T7]SHL17719.1 protein of unknown function [Haladaptatus paucihalophilus DX253]
MNTADIPETLPRRKRKSIERVRTVSRLLDEAFRIPGTQFRVGLDPILGLLPVGGDLASALISLYIALEGYRMDVPRHVLARMLANVAIDTFGGSVPVLGSVFDAAWKANRKNRALIERHVERY